jgi:hypothetical protein
MSTTTGLGAPAKGFVELGAISPRAMATLGLLEHEFDGLAGAGALRSRIFTNSYRRQGTRLTQ